MTTPPDALPVSAELDRLVSLTGSGSHPYVLSGSLFHGPASQRNLADAVHYIAKLHGRAPSIADLAPNITLGPDAAAWLNGVKTAFSSERAYLARLAGASGPLPAAANQSRYEATIASHVRTLTMLANSEREGSALGAALAFALEWLTLRALLSRAAERIDFHSDTHDIPTLDLLCHAADRSITGDLMRRAMIFGARQLIAIHRMMWDELASRAADHAAH